METVVGQDSPLAAYLEGKGEAEDNAPEELDAPGGHDAASAPLAPHGRPKPSHFLQNVARPVLRNSTVSRLRKIYAAAVNSTLGSADNERFLEQFRYHVIASQLLNENVGAVPASATFSPTCNLTHAVPYPGVAAVSTRGAVVAAVLAFGLAWAIHWARHGTFIASPTWRILIVIALLVCFAVGLNGYITRRWLRSLRRQAIESATGFVANLQSFEGSSTAVLTLIQEVELVSRGYRLSSPLPPVSRIEGSGQSRSCARLRRSLQACYVEVMPAVTQAIADIRAHVDADEVERFLDVYDVRIEDVEEASLGCTTEEGEVGASLKCLRINQAKFGTLRRLLLCSLLALHASGRRDDSRRWRSAVDCMDYLGKVTGQLAERLIKLLSDEEQVATPITPNRRASLSQSQKNPSHGRVQSQVRRISALSTNIRSLQAKLFLLRDESTRALQTPMSEGDLSELSGSLREQYDALGADLQSLMQAWEAGKRSLSQDITRSARRISRSSSVGDDGYRVSIGSASGLDTVSENGLLNSPRGSSRFPLSPPATESGSEDMTGDDEVFEALSAPRQRPKSMMTRDERIAHMYEERERLARVRERQEVGTSMVKELQSIIKLRGPPVRPQRPSKSHERTTSV